MKSASFLYCSLLLFLICFYLPTYAQLETAHWYFGREGLNFQQLPPRLISNSALRTSAQPVVISDSATGDLLFYSDGTQVWDRNHAIMANGDSLAGTTGLIFSQPAIIVPVADRADQYYLFTLKRAGESQIGGLDVSSLHYSVVDMRGNNGLGEVSTKNRHLYDSLDNTVTAIPFADEEGYWLIATKTEDKHCFVVWSITSEGVGVPVKQCTDLNPINTANALNARMKPSPDGQMLALTQWQFDPGPFYLFRFNDTTGVLADPLVVGNLSQQIGLSFSPDSRQLYLSAYDSTILPQHSGPPHIVHQFEVSHYDSVAISRSLTAAPIPDFSKMSDLQLGLDGQLYGIRNFLTADNRSPAFLTVIQDPNLPGFGSQIQLRSLEDRRFLYTVFPNFMQHYFRQDLIHLPDSGKEEGDLCDPHLAVQLFPNPATAQITIQVEEPCFDPYTLRIIAPTGQLLGDAVTVTEMITTVNVQSLATGMYLAELRFDDRVVSKKFIVR